MRRSASSPLGSPLALPASRSLILGMRGSPALGPMDAGTAAMLQQHLRPGGPANIVRSLSTGPVMYAGSAEGTGLLHGPASVPGTGGVAPSMTGIPAQSGVTSVGIGPSPVLPSTIFGLSNRVSEASTGSDTDSDSDTDSTGSESDSSSGSDSGSEGGGRKDGGSRLRQLKEEETAEKESAGPTVEARTTRSHSKGKAASVTFEEAATDTGAASAADEPERQATAAPIRLSAHREDEDKDEDEDEEEGVSGADTPTTPAESAGTGTDSEAEGGDDSEGEGDGGDEEGAEGGANGRPRQRGGLAALLGFVQIGLLIRVGIMWFVFAQGAPPTRFWTVTVLSVLLYLLYSGAVAGAWSCLQPCLVRCGRGCCRCCCCTCCRAADEAVGPGGDNALG